MDVIVTPKEAAARFREMSCFSDSYTVSERMFRQMCANGELVTLRVGKRWYINLTKSFPDVDWAPRRDVIELERQAGMEEERAG